MILYDCDVVNTTVLDSRKCRIIEVIKKRIIWWVPCVYKYKVDMEFMELSHMDCGWKEKSNVK